jgi:polyisoprenyl-phosphate glycosyltransferase
MKKSLITLNKEINKLVLSLKGPVLVVGAGGFIGVNLLNALLAVRDDVIGVSRDYTGNWRFLANKIPLKNLSGCDITDSNQVRNLINNYKPVTVFNLAAYGAYSKQAEYEKIYQTNFIGAVHLIEALKEFGFSAFVQAGSSSEYGLNSAAPREDSLLTPNSHYAVSKAAVYHAVKYFGKIENLPLVHLRVYSAYGQWEEPDRLIPVVIAAALKKNWPPLVNPNISRDFIHVADVVSAFLHAAIGMNQKHYGECYNVGTGIKTSIKELTEIIKEKFEIENNPNFSSMPDRKWDLIDWYSDSSMINETLGWSYSVDLINGIEYLAQWQKDVDFENAFWNWTNKI